MASCYVNMKKLEVSKYFLERCIKQFPTYYEAQLQAGTVGMKLKEFPNAIAYLNEAIELDKSKVEPHLLKADCYLQSNSYSRAYEEYKLIYMQFESVRNQLSFQVKYYYSMLKSDEVDMAYEHINKLIEKKSDSAEALYIRGKI